MRTFRVFVSSTFSDLQAERDALQKKVFPRLQELCLQHGARFQAVDLRWGVSAEAGQSQRTMQICLEEIRRCQVVTPRPNFILLLGDRYGWQPLPEAIPAQLFEQILERVAAGRDGERRCSLVQQWYRRDDNAVPPQYDLQPREAVFEDYAHWRLLEKELVNILRQSTHDMNLTTAEHLRFGGSATEQEIVAGTFVSGAAKRVFCFIRSITGLMNETVGSRFIDIADGKIDAEARARLESLKQRLRQYLPGNTYEYEAQWTSTGITDHHVDQLCGDVYDCLSKVILEEVAGWKHLDELEREKRDQAEFGQQRSSPFVGRAPMLDQVESHIMSGSRSPLAIIGQSGVGKTTFVAKSVEQAIANHLDTVVVYRFIGATPASSDVRLLLRGLCRELSRAYGANEVEIPEAYQDLVPAFVERLAYASAAKPLIVFLDALDQLFGINDGSSFPWIPSKLPPFVRLIVTALPDLRSILSGIVTPENLIELVPLTPDEGETLLNVLLAEAGRTLQPGQRRLVLDRFIASPLPLYLRLVFEQAKYWKSYANDQTLGADIPSVIANLLAQLSDEAAHGAVLVARSLAYLAAAKNGLAEDELLMVLSADSAVMADFRQRSPNSPPVDKLPPIIWSRLYFDLAPYLARRTADGAALLSFFHRQFREEVTRAYLSADANQQHHQALAQFFTDQPLYVSNDASSTMTPGPNLRRLSELPYQLTRAGMWPESKATLLDFRFLEAKVLAVGPYPLIEDFERLLVARRQQVGQPVPSYEDTLTMVQDAVRLSAHIFQRAPNQFCGQLVGHMAASEDPDIQRLMTQVQPTYPTIWFRPVTQSLRPTGDPMLAILGGHAAVVWQVVVSTSGRFAVSVGNDSTVVVWDLTAGVELYRLSALPAPILSAAIDPQERFFVCAANSLLLRFDLLRRTKLQECDPRKGWIRALAVRPDGRTVIFATDDVGLLAWTLATNEVRLCVEQPFARISAIQLFDDGRRAVAGSTDWMAGGPGSVVLWDLESGARLNEWALDMWDDVGDLAVTPDQKTVVTGGRSGTLTQWDMATGTANKTFSGHSQWVDAIAVTPDGTRLISGAADERIKVWDLATGVERATLWGNHGTVRTLAMLPDGQRFLSGSDDQTVRLWDLSRVQYSAKPQAHAGQVNALALTPDGQYVLSASDDRTLKLWKVQTGELVRSYEGHETAVWYAAITADGRRIVSVGNVSRVIVWDLASGQKMHELHLYPPFSSSTHQLVLSPDGNSFFYSGAQFDTNTGAELRRFPEDSASILALSPDGGRAVTGSTGVPLKIWDLARHIEVGNLGSDALSATLLPDGRLVTGSYSAHVRVWDLKTCTLERELYGHRGPVHAVAATRDGKRAVSASGDYDLKLWDLETGRNLATFSTEAPLWSCALMPDGQMAFAGDELGHLHFLKIMDTTARTR